MCWLVLDWHLCVRYVLVGVGLVLMSPRDVLLSVRYVEFLVKYKAVKWLNPQILYIER